jgi:hypothetical protein
LAGGLVFLVSSVLVTVPSDDWVTVFSFDLTVPSLLTLLLSVGKHPFFVACYAISRHYNARQLRPKVWRSNKYPQTVNE